MSKLNAWVNGEWAPVDLTGPPGIQGAQGVPGAYTWPASNFANFTGARNNTGDGSFEPDSLNRVGIGANPGADTFSGNRVIVLRAGLVYAVFVASCGPPQVAGNSWVNIRNVSASDSIVADTWVAAGEDWASCAGIFPVSNGDVLRIIYTKQTGGQGNIGYTLRLVFLV